MKITIWTCVGSFIILKKFLSNLGNSCLEPEWERNLFKTIRFFWSRALFPDPLYLAPGNNLACAPEKSISNCVNFITSWAHACRKWIHQPRFQRGKITLCHLKNTKYIYFILTCYLLTVNKLEICPNNRQWYINQALIIK